MTFCTKGISVALEDALKRRLCGERDDVCIEAYSAGSQYDALLAQRTFASGRTVRVALDGNGFHGQHDRSWQAGRGNLYLCMSVSASPVGRPEWLQMTGPLAVARAVAPFVCVPLRIRPVNDVLIGEGKLAGTLTNYRVQGGGQRIFWGIGLNCSFAPACDQPTACVLDFATPAARSAEACTFDGDGVSMLWVRLLAALVTELDRVTAEFEAQPEAVQRKYKHLLIHTASAKK